MKKLRVALLGAGPMGLAMALNMQKSGRATVTAFCDKSPSVLENAAKAFREATGESPAVFASHEALQQNGQYEAIMIACSPEVQPALAVCEMNRGIHVLCQVPVAVTMEDCKELVQAAEQNDVIFVGAEQARYWYFVGQWRAMAQAGVFGKILFAEGEYLHYAPKWDWFVDTKTNQPVVTDDATLLDQPGYDKSWRYRLFNHPILYLPHTLSPLLSITGGHITKVSCFGTRPESYYSKGFEARDIETAIMMTDRDTVFQVKTGFTSPHGFKRGTGAHWYQIKGSKATVEWSRSEEDSPKLYTPEQGWQAMEWPVENPNESDEIRQSGHGGADYYPIRDFLDAILLEHKPAVDVYTSVELAAPAIAAAQSSQQGGQLISVPDFRHLTER